MHPVLASVSMAMLVNAISLPLAGQWATERHRLLPDSVPTRVAAGDMDGDGDVDLVFAEGADLYVVPNDGAGRFRSARQPIAQVLPFVPVALGDIDGDGDLDVAVGGRFVLLGYFPGQLFRNDGAGLWTDVSAQWASVDESTIDLRFCDYDGDGDQDLLTLNPVLGQVVSVQPINRLYLNDGSGVFTDVTASRMPAPLNNNTSVATGDLDGDGDQDIVLTGAHLSSAVGGSVRVLLQNAAGVALEAPGLVPHPSLPYGGYWHVVLIDFENDGDLDIAAASSDGLHFFVNGGGAGFTLAQNIADAEATRFTAGDFDGDGRTDLLAVRSKHRLPQPCRLYRNTAGGFVDGTASGFAFPEAAIGELLAFDCEQDGDTDVLCVNAPQPELWHNDGQGRLLRSTRDELSRPQTAAAQAADADLDGDLDLLVIERIGVVGAAYVAPNDGQGPTSAITTLVSPGLANPAHATWIDADLDGDLDVFVATHGIVGLGSTPRDYLFHQLAGTFVDVSAGQLPGGGVPPVGATRDVTVGDIDGDGRPDLLLPHRILRNVAAAGFVAASAQLPATAELVTSAAWLDFDADGDLDTVEARPYASGPSLALFANAWPAAFVDVTASHTLPPVAAAAVATADVDRDGNRDLLVGGTGVGGVGNGIHLLRSVGTGFVDETAARLPLIFDSVVRLEVGDLDGDGWSDLRYWTGSSSAPNTLRNVAGVFSATTPFGGLPQPLASADLDGDGDADLVTAVGVLRNRTRDLQDAVPPRAGRTGELVLHANGGNGVDPQAVLLLLSPQLAPLPITTPFGALSLDPALADFHSGHLIPGSGGEVTIAYPVPAAPGVLGATLFAQCVFVHEPAASTWRLGNLVTLRVQL